jgi:proteasome lid subunit RPN8/RPN11
MILGPLAVLKDVVDAAEATYPEEVCGLLVGRQSGENTLLTRAVHSINVADGDRRRRFEVDPKVRFDVMRTLEGTDDSIVGHFHSHPDQPAEPSSFDREMIFEPGFLWLIVSVVDGQAVQVGCFRPTSRPKQFRRVSLRTHL